MNTANSKVIKYMYRHNITHCRRFVCEIAVRVDPITRKPIQLELKGYCSQHCKDLDNNIVEPFISDFD